MVKSDCLIYVTDSFQSVFYKPHAVELADLLARVGDELDPDLGLALEH